LIEGLIILGIAAIVIVVALFGTTIISILTSIAASISAMITGAVTGTATLLTSWYTWAIASDITNYYIGYIWLASWLSLFAYSGYKIATSDKKKWMNLVGRGSNYLGVILILFLVAQPLVVSFGASYLADTTAYSEVEYNITNEVETAYDALVLIYNTSAGYESETQTETFDNSTSERIIASMDIPTITGTKDSVQVAGYMNLTFCADVAVTKITFSYLYVGTGNVTGLKFQKTLPSPAKEFISLTDSVAIAGRSNYTYTWLPEVFEQNQISTITKQMFVLAFEDAANLPSDGDYLSIAIKYYTTATVLNQETIMLWLGASMAALDIMGLLYASGFLSKYIL